MYGGDRGVNVVYLSVCMHSVFGGRRCAIVRPCSLTKSELEGGALREHLDGVVEWKALNVPTKRREKHSEVHGAGGEVEYPT